MLAGAPQFCGRMTAHNGLEHRLAQRPRIENLGQEGRIIQHGNRCSQVLFQGNQVGCGHGSIRADGHITSGMP